MKLFQKLLLAPTAIGLLAPITASASEANLMDVSSYSQVDVEVTQDTFKPLSTKNPLLAGGEGLGQDLTNDFDGDTFSSTTSASFASNWAIGAIDGTAINQTTGASHEKVSTTFDWSLSTVTSFTGNDSLDVAIKGGSGDQVLTELDFYGSSTSAADNLSVDSISYTSSVGDYLTYFFGFGTDGSLLYNTACAYEAQTEVFSSCGLSNVALDTGNGTNFGATIDVGNGLFVSVGYDGEGANSDGLMSKEGQDHYGGQLAYIQDNWGVSLSASHRDYATKTAAAPVNVTRDFTAINGFFVPEIDGFPSVSFGYEWSHAEGTGFTDTTDNMTNYFVGFQFDDLGNGTLGVAVGSKAPVVENVDAETMWEAYYAYNYADGITITPLVYVKEEADAGVDDETGIILKTSFEF